MFWSICRIKIKDCNYIEHLNATSIYLETEDVEAQNFLEISKLFVKKHVCYL